MTTIYTQQYETFVERLKAERLAADCSQTELAKRLGKPQSYVSKVEARQRRLDMVEYANWAQALGIDGVALFEKLVLDIASPTPTSTRRRLNRL